MPLAATRTRIIQTIATIRTPTATEEENKDTTVIATVHLQASPSSSSLSSLHAPTCVNNSGTWTFNVCSDLPSLKDLDDNMDDDNNNNNNKNNKNNQDQSCGTRNHHHHT